GRLWAVRGGAERAVWVRRCFPWSEPARFVSLRDDEEREFALVRDPAELDPASRRVLEEAMVAAGFVFEITQVTAIEEEVEIRHWRVEARQGTRSFQTRLDALPRPLALCSLRDLLELHDRPRVARDYYAHAPRAGGASHADDHRIADPQPVHERAKVRRARERGSVHRDEPVTRVQPRPSPRAGRVR